jgi:hypothetical protein
VEHDRDFGAMGNSEHYAWFGLSNVGKTKERIVEHEKENL